MTQDERDACLKEVTALYRNLFPGEGYVLLTGQEPDGIAACLSNLPLPLLREALHAAALDRTEVPDQLSPDPRGMM